MKKYLAIVIIIMMFVCCGCEYGGKTIDYESILVGESIEGTYEEFKNINVESSYLGYGYDIINDEYIKKDYINLSAPILDLSKIENTRLMLVKENNAETIEIVGENIEDFSSKYNVAMKVYGKVGNVFSGGLSIDFNGSQNIKTYCRFYKNILNVRTFNLYLTNSIDELKNLLSEEFKKDLLKLHPEALFDKYGTHMLKEVSMGGRIEVSAQYTSTTAGSSVEVNTAVNAHTKFLKNNNFNAEAMSQLEANLQNQNIDIYYNVKQIGGALTNINSISSLNEKYDKWLESFDENINYSALSGIVGENSLIALWDLLPEEEVDRREALYLTFKELSGDSFEKLCQDFKINTKRILNVSVEGNGKINEVNYQYEDGEEVKLIATPEEDSRFIGWYNGEKLVSNSVEFTFNIHVNTNLIARFKKLNDNSCLLIVHVTGKGEVLGNDKLDYLVGEKITLDAKPFYNNEFVGWYIDNNLVSTNPFYVFEITEDVMVVAKFTSNEIEKCLLVVNKIGDGNGEVEYVAEHYMRSVATVKAKPSEGSKFVCWYIDNIEYHLTNPELSFVISEDTTIFAKFDLIKNEEFVISTSIFPENSGKIDGTKGSFAKGELVTIIGMPENGYKFVRWEVMNEKVEANPYSFYIQNNIHIVAVFEEDSRKTVMINYDLSNEQYGLKASIRDNYIEVEENSIPEFCVPSSDYLVFEGWFIDGEVQISDEQGNILHNVENYTDAYGAWIGQGCNLVAKWNYNSNYKFINNSQDLQKINEDLNGNYVLTTSIDLQNLDFSPLGEFKGTFDGNSYTLSNLLMEQVFTGELGLFKVNYGTIMNLNIENFNIINNDPDVHGTLLVGFLCGKNNGIIKNVNIIGGCINVDVGNLKDSNDNYIYLGAICGQNEKDINNCSAIYTSLEAYAGTKYKGARLYVGGIVGYSIAGNICDLKVKNVKINCTVKANSNAGLLICWEHGRPYIYAGAMIGVSENTIINLDKNQSMNNNILATLLREGCKCKTNKECIINEYCVAKQ